MDSSSWIHGCAANGDGFICGYAASCREEEQLQQHLDQISMHMNLDDVEPAAYHSISGDISSVLDDLDFLPNSHRCSFPSSAPATGLQFPHGDQYVTNFHDTPAPGGMSSTSTSAFRRYERHLGPRRRPACGQRMFKTAMSVLDKMHTAMRSGNQLQHVISERRRREKHNESFHALKAVLPPGSKKDKTSVLIMAAEYVNSLESKIRELEEKHQALQAQLPTSREVDIQITTAAEGDESGEVKISVRPACGNTTDMVLRTLRCLKEKIGEDLSLVSVTTGEDDHGPGPNLTLHLKSASGAKWEEDAVREAVMKAVADTQAYCHAPSCLGRS
ncbi:unnamed protein product [Alopecurus aequalis]